MLAMLASPYSARDCVKLTVFMTLLISVFSMAQCGRCYFLFFIFSCGNSSLETFVRTGIQNQRIRNNHIQSLLLANVLPEELPKWWQSLILIGFPLVDIGIHLASV